ncbi:MAG: PEP-CTERM sorting domain-containing protein [Armatimonadota bacterium]|nr:PEP-CTERM sorting domain-containing protein [Armatimonadota bacterium]
MSNSSRLFRTAIVVGALLVALALSICANAATVASRSDHLIGYGTVNDLLLNVVVDYDAGIYTYNYSLQYLTGSDTVHLFSVENESDVAYTNAWNSGDFLNPAYDPDAYAYEVLWQNGNLLSGSTRQFSYKSVYGWREIPVTAYASSGGDSADGFTYGMTTNVPEPSSLAGLALAAFALPALRRRRK